MRMGDVMLSGNALVLVSGVVSALVAAIGYLFRQVLAGKDAQIVQAREELGRERANTKFWRDLTFNSGQQADQMLVLGRKAARALQEMAAEASP